MPSLRVLFVDDDAARFQRLKAVVADGGALASIRWRKSAAAVQDDDLVWAELVLLDHDMCEAGEYPAACPNVPVDGRASQLVLPPCRCPTGVAVATRIAQVSPAPRVVVQSVNLPGASAIAGVLSDAGVKAAHIPFTSWFNWEAGPLWRQITGGA